MTTVHPDTPHDIERLRALQKTGLLSSPAPSEFRWICEAALTRFDVIAAMITLVAEDRITVAAWAGMTLNSAPRLGQFCDRTIQGDGVLVVPDATRDPLLAGHPMVAGLASLRFYAGAPLLWVRGVRLGALCLLDRTPRAFGPEEQADLEQMAEEAMSALANREFDRIAEATFH